MIGEEVDYILCNYAAIEGTGEPISGEDVEDIVR